MERKSGEKRDEEGRRERREAVGGKNGEEVVSEG